ncbi:unnamed protein product [Moneuplotes crassus]|uniref:Uncharacterized protein n=1 Tax=Euplotes crassus TaxID=5936 RepID=A0AAD1Y6K1_EUPCR|nr:unnamed protein product [Moneuplotes crassus]
MIDFCIKCFLVFRKAIFHTFKKNEAETQDGFFSYTPDGDETEFIGVDTVSQEISSIGADNPLFNMKFVKDSRSKSYERSVFNFLEVTGNMGGLFEILEICGESLWGFSLARRFSTPSFQNCTKSMTQKSKMITICQKLSKIKKNNKIRKIRNWIEKKIYLTEQNEKCDTRQIWKKELLRDKAMNAMRKRIKYDWKITDYIFNLFRCLSFICCCCCCNKRSLNFRNRLRLYDKGESKLAKELDAVHFVKSFRNLSTLVASVVDDRERLMIAYQKCHLLSLQSDTSNSCSDENFDSIPKMFAKASTKELHQIKVENFMAEYSKEKWTDKDYKLLNGVFNREKLSQEQIETLMNHMDNANIYQGINEKYCLS